MSQFLISGRFQGRTGFQAFEKQIEAPNENVAREFALSRLGSEHGLKRTQVEIEGVTAA
ncbi:MAG: 50S ribosomal protein L18Ae [Haloplanus sp.]